MGWARGSLRRERRLGVSRFEIVLFLIPRRFGYSQLTRKINVSVVNNYQSVNLLGVGTVQFVSTVDASDGLCEYGINGFTARGGREEPRSRPLQTVTLWTIKHNGDSAVQTSD